MRRSPNFRWIVAPVAAAALLAPPAAAPGRLRGGRQRLGGASDRAGVEPARLPRRRLDRLSPRRARPRSGTEAGAQRRRTLAHAAQVLAGFLLPLLHAELEDDRGAQRPGTRQAQAGPDRRSGRCRAGGSERLLRRLQLLARREPARLLGGRERQLSGADRRLPGADRRRQEGPADEGPQLAGPSLGP